MKGWRYFCVLCPNFEEAEMWMGTGFLQLVSWIDKKESIKLPSENTFNIHILYFRFANWRRVREVTPPLFRNCNSQYCLSKYFLSKLNDPKFTVSYFKKSKIANVVTKSVQNSKFLSRCSKNNSLKLSIQSKMMRRSIFQIVLVRESIWAMTSSVKQKVWERTISTNEKGVWKVVLGIYSKKLVYYFRQRSKLTNICASRFNKTVLDQRFCCGDEHLHFEEAGVAWDKYRKHHSRLFEDATIVNLIWLRYYYKRGRIFPGALRHLRYAPG